MLLEMLLTEEQEEEEEESISILETISCPYCEGEAKLIDVQHDLNFVYIVYFCEKCGRIFQEKRFRHRFSWLLSNVY